MILFSPVAPNDPVVRTGTRVQVRLIEPPSPPPPPVPPGLSVPRIIRQVIAPQPPVVKPADHSDPAPSPVPSPSASTDGGRHHAGTMSSPPATLLSAPIHSPVSQDLSYNRRIKPRYPHEALRLNHEGTVLLRVRVGTDGLVKDIQVEKSSYYHELDQSAINAVQHWRFNPETVNGQKVEGYARVPVHFFLE